MTALLFAPHHDDETLWASFLCQTYRPLVVTVLQSEVQEAQGITNEQRKRETLAAMKILGCDWIQWPEYDRLPDWAAVEAMMRKKDERADIDHVYAPWPNPPYGHEHHDEVGRLALEVFGADRVTWYTTYNYGASRQDSDYWRQTPNMVGGFAEVPYTGEMLLRKLQALACYESQILRGPRRFFAMALDEWTVTP